METWALVRTEADKKVYRNENTKTECVLDVIYRDKDGRKWWGFQDLFTLPFMRKATAKTITDLFSVGVTAWDLKEWIKKEKTILKSADSEKYEKLYAMVLEKEAAVAASVDPVKHYLGLATVYILEDKERVDYFSQEVAASKLEQWAQDWDMQAFFLSWVIGHIENSTKDYSRISGTVSKIAGGLI